MDGTCIKPLREAAVLLGLPYERLKTMVRRGAVPSVSVKQGKRVLLCVDVQSVLQVTGVKKTRPWPEIESGWRESMRNGWLSSKPIGANTIENYRYGLTNYWLKLNQPKELKAFNLENLRTVLSTYTPDYVEQKCFYETKILIYKAFRSLAKYLIETKEVSSSAFEGLEKLTPKRIFPPRKTVVYKDGYKTLIDNATGDAFDKGLTRIIIHLGVLAGLRKSEMVKLNTKDLLLDRGELWVKDGKGHKTRTVGMREDLIQACKEWLEIRKIHNNEAFLVMRDGRRITPQVLRGRLERLRKRVGLDITLHGLRRAFVTIHADEGIPLTHLQLMAGHRDLKTTQSYTLTNIQTAMDSLRNFKQKKIPPPKNDEGLVIGNNMDGIGGDIFKINDILKDYK